MRKIRNSARRTGRDSDLGHDPAGIVHRGEFVCGDDANLPLLRLLCAGLRRHRIVAAGGRLRCGGLVCPRKRSSRLTIGTPLERAAGSTLKTISRVPMLAR